jgi:hypothetical protein
VVKGEMEKRMAEAIMGGDTLGNTVGAYMPSVNGGDLCNGGRPEPGCAWLCIGLIRRGIVALEMIVYIADYVKAFKAE